MVDTRDKARALRLERLGKMLSERLTQPPAALETLLDELGRGERRPEDWESLHGAATRDQQEAELGSAYQKILTPHRMRGLTPELQVLVLMHAADFFQGIVGDLAAAEGFLERILEVDPSHTEAFDRLERRRKAGGDKRGLIRLYSLIAAAPHGAPTQLATRVADLLIVPLPAKTPLSDATCLRLVSIAHLHPQLLDLIDAHCQATERVALGFEVRERSLKIPDLPEATAQALRRRLVERYLEANALPASAMDHVEVLSARSPGDPVVLKAADRLLRDRSVASRAAALLKDSRLASPTSAARGTGRPPPR